MKAPHQKRVAMVVVVISLILIVFIMNYEQHVHLLATCPVARSAFIDHISDSYLKLSDNDFYLSAMQKEGIAQILSLLLSYDDKGSLIQTFFATECEEIVNIEELTAHYEKRFAFLGDTMGLGKSLMYVVLAACFAVLFQQHKTEENCPLTGKLLIVGPLTAYDSIIREFQKFAFHAFNLTTIDNGVAERQIKEFFLNKTMSFEVLLIKATQLDDCGPFLAAHANDNGTIFDLVTVDEAHMFKAGSTNITNLTIASWWIQYLSSPTGTACLFGSGTLMPNEVSDLLSLLFLAGDYPLFGLDSSQEEELHKCIVLLQKRMDAAFLRYLTTGAKSNLLHNMRNLVKKFVVRRHVNPLLEVKHEITIVVPHKHPHDYLNQILARA